MCRRVGSLPAISIRAFAALATCVHEETQPTPCPFDVGCLRAQAPRIAVPCFCTTFAALPLSAACPARCRDHTKAIDTRLGECHPCDIGPNSDAPAVRSRIWHRA